MKTKLLKLLNKVTAATFFCALCGCGLSRKYLLERQDTPPPGYEPINMKIYLGPSELLRHPVGDAGIDIERAKVVFAASRYLGTHLSEFQTASDDLIDAISDETWRVLPSDTPAYPSKEEVAAAPIFSPDGQKALTTDLLTAFDAPERGIAFVRRISSVTAGPKQKIKVIDYPFADFNETVLNSGEDTCSPADSCKTAAEFVASSGATVSEKLSDAKVDELKLRSVYVRSVENNEPHLHYQFVIQCANATLSRNGATLTTVTWPRLVVHQTNLTNSPVIRSVLLRNVLTVHPGANVVRTPVSMQMTSLRGETKVNVSLRRFTFDGASSKNYETSGESYFYSIDNYTNRVDARYRDHLSRFFATRRSATSSTHSFASYQIPLNKVYVEGEIQRNEFGKSVELAAAQLDAYKARASEIPQDKWRAFFPVVALGATGQRLSFSASERNESEPDFQRTGLHYIDTENFVAKHVPVLEPLSRVEDKFFEPSVPDRRERSDYVPRASAEISRICTQLFPGGS